MDVDETPEVRGQETGSGEEETESGSEHEAEVRGRLSFRDAPRAGMPTQTWRSLSQLNQSNKGEAERRRLAGRRRVARKRRSSLRSPWPMQPRMPGTSGGIFRSYRRQSSTPRSATRG